MRSALAANSALPILWVLAIQLAAWGCGRPLWRVITGRRPRGAAAALEAQVLGLAALGLAALALAAGGRLADRWLVPLVMLASLAGLMQPPRLGRCRTAGLRSALCGATPVLLVLAGIVVLGFLPAALSPLLDDRDAAIHLVPPGLLLEAGRLIPAPAPGDTAGPTMPALLEAVAIAGADFTAPKLLTASFLAWTMVGLWGLVRPLAGRLPAAVAVLLLVSGRSVQAQIGTAAPNLALGAALLAALSAGLAWRRRGRHGRLVVAVCCLAFAATAALGVHGSIAAGPSPVEELHARRELHAAANQLGNDATRLLRLPYDLAWRADAYGAPAASAALLLLLAAGALAAPWSRGPARWLPLVALGGLIAWALAIPRGDLLVGWAPMMAAGACLPLAGRAGRARRQLPVLVAAALAGALGGYQLAAQPGPRWGDLGALGPARGEQLQANASWPLCARLAVEVPPGGRIVALWENRFFFLPHPFSADTSLVASSALARLRAVDDAAAFAAELEAAGVSHLVLHTARARRYFENRIPGVDLLHPKLYPAARLARDGELLRVLVASHLEPAFELPPHRVYRLRRSP